jgi:hypothetical protein
MDKADFDLIEQHGYETAKWNLRLFSNATPRGGAAVASGAMARPDEVR